MKKTVLSAIATIALTTALSAEIKPYIGIGYNSFTIYNSDVTITDSGNYNNYSYTSELFFSESDDKGNAIAFNGGIILTNNSKINLSFFTGKENDTKEMTASVIGISYDYSFNNYGTRKGWYIGSGLSKITVQFDETSKPNVELNHEASSESSTGLFLKGGLEYQADNNLLFDIGYTFNTAQQNHEFKGKNSDGTTRDEETWKTTTDITYLNISISYLF